MSKNTVPPPAAAMTPMMAQYFEIKTLNPGYLLFYRMGDFYELFFDDAEIAATALGIVLTKRGKHLGDDIPMCGVPVHAAQDYLKKLIALGHRVAICEQVEDPAEAKKRGSKSVVKRDVVRLVTPGTLTEDDLLPARANNYLAALSCLRHGDTDFALAWADISTGETWLHDLRGDALADELGRIEPAELILSATTQALVSDERLLPAGLAAHITVTDAALFDSEHAGTRLRDGFPGLDPTAYTRAARSALGAMLAYVAETQKTAGVTLRAPRHLTAVMAIDPATRNALELLATNRGEARGSLRQAIDMTVTAAGGRLLARRLAAPSCEADIINARLDMVDYAVADTPFTAGLRARLRVLPDITRALTRLALERGGPRDLAAIGTALTGAGDLAGLLTEARDLPPGLADIQAELAKADLDLAAELDRAIRDDPPLLARDGQFVREGYDANLDSERALASESRRIIAELQARLATETGIKPLKIKHNNVLGYFIEVPAAHGPKLTGEPFAQSFIHRQTMANAMRFTTAELVDLQSRISRAHEAALQIEQAIFAQLRARVLALTARLQHIADALAALDVATALATLAAEQGYCRPKIDGSVTFAIEAGRHPVVEQTLSRSAETQATGPFVANDCDLTADNGAAGALWLITGPNMGGKSTFLRQNALIAILAQMGSFVPAAAAHIGIVDRVFSRVGASDDIAHGRSTFMVEMVETAAILNRATSRSLVVLDEIGRGTATFDGLSIAWATVEALHNTNRCRALFATHFHELTRLAGALDRVSNHTMKVREWEGEVVFLHEVDQGAADRSYGIQVARLAGLPAEVVERARQVLALLEQDTSRQGGAVLDDLPLFTQAPPPSPVRPAAENKVLNLIDQTHPDQMTPLEAIELIYELKKARNADRSR